MADISGLGLKEVDPIDYENEAVSSGGQSFAPPPEGKYTGRVVISDDIFGATTEGYLKASFKEIEIIGTENGKGVGYKIRYQMPLSVKKYKGREGNSFLDFLRAVGFAGRPKSNEEYVAALKSASGKPFQFALYWEAWDKDTQETTKGQENFPPDPQNPNQRLHFIEGPDPNDPDKKKRVYANGKVKYYISAIKKEQ